MNKQELIGTIWECPKCNAEVEITEKGLSHTCNEGGIYYADMSLDTYYEYKKRYLEWSREMERKMLYGK